MTLDSRIVLCVFARPMLVMPVLALLVLPSFVRGAGTEGKAFRKDEARLQIPHKSNTQTTSAFPFAVTFEQGATRFLNGDKIMITEVRGTAETFTPGNIYWIKGTYTLASHDRAMLAAFTTATDAASGKGPYLKVQTTVVTRGDGTFTLFLPMSGRGWPHVSFYPSGGGESFGGNYVGTGNSVLKRWWGVKETD